MTSTVGHDIDQEIDEALAHPDVKARRKRILEARMSSARNLIDKAYDEGYRAGYTDACTLGD